MGKKLRDGFSAFVKLTSTGLVVTAAGPVEVPDEVFIKPGGELPDNLAKGEEDRLDKLGAFTPLPSYAERVRRQGAALAANPAFQENYDPELHDDGSGYGVPFVTPPSLAHATAPAGEAVTTPGGGFLDDVEDEPAPRKASGASKASK